MSCESKDLNNGDDKCSETKISDTANRLTHRVKNLLQSVSGGRYLIQNGLENNSIESVATGWGIVQRNQDDINQLVSSFLILTNECALQLESGCICEVIDSAISQLCEVHPTATQLIRWKPNPTLKNFSFDSQKTSSTISILLAQAQLLDASSESTDAQELGPVIEVGVGQSEKECLIYVAIANCTPLTATEIENFFSPNETNHETSNAILRGIHLSAARKIVAAHGGKLDFKVNEFGSGQFSVRLPLG